MGWLGSVRRSRQIPQNILAALALVLVSALVLFIAFASITRKTSLQGVLLPAAGTVQVKSPRSATLSRLLVTVGQKVKRGDALAILIIEQQTSLGDSLNREVSALEEKGQAIRSQLGLVNAQYSRRIEAAVAHLASIERELKESQEERRLFEMRVAIGRATYAAYERLVADGFYSPLLRMQKEGELLELEARLKSMDKAIEGLVRERKAASFEPDAAKNDAEMSRKNIEQSLADLQRASVDSATKGEVQLMAAQDGIIDALMVNPGDTAIAGQSLMTIIPSAGTSDVKLDAYLFATGRTVGLISNGQQVRVRYSAFPYQRYGYGKGVIEGVASSPVAMQDLPASLADALRASIKGNEPVYRIHVRLEEQALSNGTKLFPLKNGMTLEADAVLDQRRVYEWIFEPIIRATKKIN
ncbi:HlyD family secretion protein [Roseateles chitinivorans]|uniref:HlyD family secretion protein n=1 Tax=Roseateles chitinivorans TaxID=2917965 RepID=UPI003D66890D